MEKEFKRIAVYLAMALLLMLVSGILGGIIGHNKGVKSCAPRVTDTIVINKTDTVTLVGNKVDSLIRIVDRPYPVPVTDTFWRDDTMFVSLPYEHRYYCAEDTLEVWYSGVDPKIDSAIVYMHHTTEIIRQSYDIAKIPRLTADIGVSALYYDRRINPFVVGEIRYNSDRTTWSVYGAVNHECEWGAGIGVSYRFDILK